MKIQYFIKIKCNIEDINNNTLTLKCYLKEVSVYVISLKFKQFNKR